MDNSFLDDFLADIPDPSAMSCIEAFRVPAPADVACRYDIFLDHRDATGGQIIGLQFSWQPPGLHQYDWYRRGDGMTVVLECQRSLARPSTEPITIRVRHEDADQDPSILKVGRTVTFDDRNPGMLEEVRQLVMDATRGGESPLWRLRKNMDLPSFVEDVLEGATGGMVGTLESRATEALLLTDMISKKDLFDAMGVQFSVYSRRPGSPSAPFSA
jgi:hypothetical protein